MDMYKCLLLYFYFGIFFADIMFISTYFMLLLFWADLHNRIANREQSFFMRAKTLVVTIIVFLIIVVGIFGILFTIFSDPKYTISEMAWADIASGIFTASLFYITAIGFIVYGIRIYYVLTHHPLVGGRRKAKRVGIVAICCTISFVARASLIIYSASQQDRVNFNIAFDLTWYWLLVMFYGLEVVPVGLMLFLFRKLPKVPTSQVNYDQFRIKIKPQRQNNNTEISVDGLAFTNSTLLVNDKTPLVT